MAKHLIRKFLGLTVLYIIIIFGIFAIQFRKELSIFQNFQSLSLRLSSTAPQTDGEESTLSNSFRVSGNGVVFFASESNPLLLHTEDGQTTPLVLQNWQDLSENSFSLIFSQDVSLLFTSFGTGFELSSTIQDNNTLTIPYETASSFNITDVIRNRSIIKSGSESFSLTAGDVTTSTITLSANTTTMARVSPFVEAQAFSYTALLGQPNASEEVFEQLTDQAKSHIVRSFQTTQGQNANEKFVAAYVAELSLQGRYAEAISNVPQSFINGTNRTYFTAPYFNTLTAMNQTLTMENENILFSMQHSLDRSLLDVYELDTFPEFLLQQQTSDIQDILTLPSRIEDFQPSIQEAVGIVAAYMRLIQYQPSSANLLTPVLQQCVDIIQSTSTQEGSLLNLPNNEGNISISFMAKAGSVLRAYAELIDSPELMAGGTMLITSVLQDPTSISTTTLADIYPYITDNPYYPHGDVLAYNGDTPVWIWNIVPAKDYSVSANGTVSMNFDFPITEIYHSIITGIEPYDGVEIHGLDYASDARFETYIASGYVYIEETKTLLLRHRQTSEVELIRLFYTGPLAQSLASQTQTLGI